MACRGRRQESREQRVSGVGRKGAHAAVPLGESQNKGGRHPAQTHASARQSPLKGVLFFGQIPEPCSALCAWLEEPHTDLTCGRD